MVIFALTRAGYFDVEPLIRSGSHVVWLNADLLDGATIEALRQSGVSVTTFSVPIDPNDIDAIDEAVATIEEHHPGERIWVERRAAD